MKKTFLSLVSIVVLGIANSTAFAQDALESGAPAEQGDAISSESVYKDTSEITGPYCELADPEKIESMNIEWPKTAMIGKELTVSIDQKKRVSFSCGLIGCTLETRKHRKIFIRAVTDAGVTTYYEARGRATILLMNKLADMPDDVPALVGCTTA